MGRTIVLAIMMIAMAAVGAASPTPVTPADEIQESVQLDAAAIHRSAMATGSVRLPTLEGEIEFEARQVRTSPVVVDDPNIAEEPVLKMTNVWALIGPGAEGTAVLREDLVQAIIRTPFGVTEIVPPHEERAEAGYVLVRPGHRDPPPGTSDAMDGHSAAGEGDASGGGSGATGDNSASLVNLPSAIANPYSTSKTLTVYVDSEFTARYGGANWPDEVEFIITEANKKFAEVGLQYEVRSMARDDSMHNTDITQAFIDLSGKSFSGSMVRAYMSYRDFDGCAIGVGSQPGREFLVQFRADACHLGATPSSEFERVYVAKHEMGHNNNAKHENAWSKWSGGHRHRSIMMASAWYHYHDVWAAENARGMCNFLGTTCVHTGTAAEAAHV